MQTSWENARESSRLQINEDENTKLKKTKFGGLARGEYNYSPPNSPHPKFKG